MAQSEMGKVNEQIRETFDRIRDEVIQKNCDYGNGLQNPIGIFSKDPIAGILGRMDDKLSRIASVGVTDKTEDTLGDLMGYIVHLKIAMATKK